MNSALYTLIWFIDGYRPVTFKVDTCYSVLHRYGIKEVLAVYYNTDYA